MDKDTLNDLHKLLNKEIEHLNTMRGQSGNSKDWEKGFIGGIVQARTIIEWLLVEGTFDHLTAPRGEIS